MTREPPFGSPASSHTLKDLQDTIGWMLYKLADLGPGADTEKYAKSLTIAIDCHIDARVEEALILRLGSAPSKD